jgi:Yip1 domain
MDQPPPVSLPNMPEPYAPPPDPKTSLAARLLNVFAIPGEVFDEVKNSPRSAGNWLVPVLLSAIVGAISVVIIFSQPAIVQQIREQQAKMFDSQVKAGKMTQAQADQAIAMAEKFSGPTMLKIVGSVGAIFGSFVRVFWWAFVLWLLGLLFLKVKFDFLKTVEVAGLASTITILGAIVTLLLTVSFGKPIVPSLDMAAGSLDPKSKLHFLFALANVFDFWLIGVMASGLARLSGAKFPRALFLVIGYWLALNFILFFVGTSLGHLMPGGK